MRFGLLLPCLLLTAALAGAEPAQAATEKPKPPLDLQLRAKDLALKPEPRRRRGYAARLREDPWRALADDPPPLAGPGIPQFVDEGEDTAEDEQFSLMRLLDGEIIPILRIRVAPRL